MMTWLTSSIHTTRTVIRTRLLVDIWSLIVCAAGNGSLDTAEVGAFWQDVFIQNDEMTEAARREAVASAVKDTFEEFDDDHDGTIDKEEFLTHLKGVHFPSFPTTSKGHTQSTKSLPSDAYDSFDFLNRSVDV